MDQGRGLGVQAFEFGMHRAVKWSYSLDGLEFELAAGCGTSQSQHIHSYNGRSDML